MAISSIYRSPLRLSGMQSGFDTESIVKSMLKIDQMKVDKQFRLKTELEWKKEAYNDITSKIRAFRDTYMSTLSDKNIFSSSAFNSFTTEVLGDKDAVSIKAGSTAMTGRMTMTIEQLAAAATARSEGAITGDVSLDTSLKDAAWAVEGGIQFEERVVASGDWGTETVNELSFSINGEEFTFNEDTLLSEVISRVNARSSETGVKMGWSSLRQGFTFTASKTGTESSIELENIKGNAFGEGGPGGIFGVSEGTYQGQQSVAIIDGVEVRRDTNSYTIDGISYTLKAETTEDITFSVERDVEPTVDKIAEFVDAYNELIKGFNDLLTQKKNYDYDPLTEEERDGLTEDEAKEWDTMAKSGILRNDTNLSQLLSGLRQSLYEIVEGTGMTAADIGLTTSTNWLDGGTLSLDKDKLRAALQEDPEKVMNIFTKSGTSADPTQNYKESGVLTRMFDSFTNAMSSINQVSLAVTNRSLDEATDKLDSLQVWLFEQEEKYWNQFTAMETALASMNSQNSSISALLGSLTQS